MKGMVLDFVIEFRGVRPEPKIRGHKYFPGKRDKQGSLSMPLVALHVGGTGDLLPAAEAGRGGQWEGVRGGAAAAGVSTPRQKNERRRMNQCKQIVPMHIGHTRAGISISVS